MAEDIPLEVWCHVFSFLPGRGLCTVEAVCKLWQEVVGSPHSRFWSTCVRREFDCSRMDHVDMGEPAGSTLATAPASSDVVIPFPWTDAPQSVWKGEYRRRFVASKKRCCYCRADIGRNFMLTPHRSRPAMCAHCALEHLMKLSAAKKMITAAGGKATKQRHGLGRYAVSEFYLSAEHTAFGCARAGYYCLRWEVEALRDQLLVELQPKARGGRPVPTHRRLPSGQAYMSRVHSVDDLIQRMQEKNRSQPIQQKVDAAKRAAVLERQKVAARLWTAACQRHGISPAYKQVSAIAKSALQKYGETGSSKDEGRLEAVADHLARRERMLNEALTGHGIAAGSWPSLACRRHLQCFVDHLGAQGTPAVVAAVTKLAEMRRNEAALRSACQQAGLGYLPHLWPKRLQAVVVNALQDADGRPPTAIAAVVDELACTLRAIGASGAGISGSSSTCGGQRVLGKRTNPP